MKAYIRIAGILTALMALVSCNDYLDIKPKGITIPEYYDDYKKLLNHKNLMSTEDNYPIYLTDDILLGGDEVEFGNINKVNEHIQNMYTFAHGAVFSAGATDPFYENAYKRLYTINTVINNADKCKDGTKAQIGSLIAEAKMARAFEYFSLVNAYARFYDRNTASSDPGVPLVTSEDINKDYKRESVQAVYDLIIQDLKDAEPFLPEYPSTRFNASKQLFHAFQTKLYLYLGEYAQALEAAGKVDIGRLEFIDYKKYSINPAKQGAMGKIWDESTQESYPYPEDNIEGIYTKSGNMVSLSRNVYASESLKGTYMKDLPEGAVDQRRALFFSDDEYQLYKNNYQFPGKTMYTAYISQNCGLGTPEFYLLYAEAAIRNNDISKGIELINTLRDNRIKGNIHFDAEGMSKERAMEIMMDERRRELAFIGACRLIDMKRYMAEGLYTEDVVHIVDGKEIRMPAGDNRLILPIPPKVLSQNPGIPQYER